MKIDLTGSSGFIGSHLKRALRERGDVVIEWDNHPSVNKHIKDYEPSPGVQYTIHLAAQADVRRSIEHPEEYWENNVTHTTRLQSVCRSHNIPLLYASSSCIHRWWLSPYGTTKKVNEETARKRQTALRFTTVYGDGARDSMFMGKLLGNTLEYSTNHIRDFIHVSDVVSAILAIIDSASEPQRRAYDIGTGIGNRVSDLATLAGYSIPVKDGAACEAPDNTADIQNMMNDFNWHPKSDVKQFISNHVFEGAPI